MSYVPYITFFICSSFPYVVRERISDILFSSHENFDQLTSYYLSLCRRAKAKDVSNLLKIIHALLLRSFKVREWLNLR
jgi:hypothetical protein